MLELMAGKPPSKMTDFEKGNSIRLDEELYIHRKATAVVDGVRWMITEVE